MKNSLTLILISLLFIKCSSNNDIATESLVDYVNPLIGTKGDGNTYPGAVAPFGMVQISPDTETKNWGTASGYEYSDSSIIGFSMTHLNGTGIPDLGDILFMPQVGKPYFVKGDKKNPDTGYRSRFSHEKEEASAGYYAVHLSDEDVYAEMTASERAGMLRFTFPESDSSFIITDLSHVLQWNIIWSNIRVESDDCVTGFHVVNGWGKERYVYFAARYSQPFDEFGIISNGERVIYNTRRFRSDSECAGKNIQFFARYNTKEKERVIIKVGISAVSTANAMKNLDAEIPHWNFDEVRNNTRTKWNNELQKIQIEGTETEKETFYSALYHAFLTPTVYDDVDGKYRGFDQNIHNAVGFNNYGIFSTWDTYRAVHPLFNLVQAERNADMINSALAHYDQSVENLLPVWSLNSNETWCMIGYHTVSLIADACVKGTPNINFERAYEAAKTTAMSPDYDSVEEYARIGYVPFNHENESVSKTLEYAYDDYSIAQMAKKMGKEEDYKYFLKRSKAYKNIFDPSTKLMRGKDSDGNWREPFYPHDYINDMNKRDITEGTNWQYTWYVPHDVNGLVELMGGKEAFATKLDTLFAVPEKMHLDSVGADDIWGRFGEYWHGNEPSHHVAYLYNFAGKPWKTQELIRRIMLTQYGNKPNSLCGNDDCGQMSAWYIFNVMGFYPIAPASNIYSIGTPCAKSATMNLSNGNAFRMKAINYSEDNVYIQSVTLNGEKYNKTYVTFDDIKNGGEITFTLGAEPNKSWGIAEDSLPESFE